MTTLDIRFPMSEGLLRLGSYQWPHAFSCMFQCSTCMDIRISFCFQKNLYTEFALQYASKKKGPTIFGILTCIFIVQVSLDGVFHKHHATDLKRKSMHNACIGCEWPFHHIRALKMVFVLHAALAYQVFEVLWLWQLDPENVHSLRGYIKIRK